MIQESQTFDRSTQILVAVITVVVSAILSAIASYLIADHQVLAGREDEVDEQLSRLQRSVTQAEYAHRAFRKSLTHLSGARDNSKLTQADPALSDSIEQLRSPALDLRSNWLAVRGNLDGGRHMSTCLDIINGYFDAILRVSKPVSWSAVNGGVVDRKRATEYADKIPGFDVRTIDTIDVQSADVAETLGQLESDIGAIRDGTSVSGNLNCEHLFFVTA